MIVLKLVLLLIVLQNVVCPPVKEPKKTDEETAPGADELEDVMEYSRYLKEVVNALESDPTFRDKLEKAEEVDIRSGKIAHELEFVSHRVRNRLDEIKRSEIERLRHLTKQQIDLEQNNEVNDDHHHLDHSNPHTFEIEDLKKLIDKTAKDLAEADRKRRAEFKEYEMQKEFEKQEQLKRIEDEAERSKQEQVLKEQELKHKKHEPLHHPGSKQQLEEVWEKQDKMEKDDFDPKTFFMYHDLDSNDYWDQNEVKMLFVKELDKMYQSGMPEDDMRERAEEMERMREHIFKEADVNRDGLISFQEFLEQTRKPDFNRDEGWEGLDQQRVYTPEEYREFERRRLEEVQHLIAQGMLPQYPPQHGYPPQQLNGVPPHGQIPPMGQGYPQQGHPQQGYPQQGHPQQGHPQQGYPQQGHPQQGYPPQGHPQQGYPQQGHPQQGYPQQGHPQQGYPQQGYPQQGNPPQMQGHPQQMQGNPQQIQGYPQQGNPKQGNPQQVQAYPQQGQPQQVPGSPQQAPLVNSQPEQPKVPENQFPRQGNAQAVNPPAQPQVAHVASQQAPVETNEIPRQEPNKI